MSDEQTVKPWERELIIWRTQNGWAAGIWSFQNGPQQMMREQWGFSTSKELGAWLADFDALRSGADPEHVEAARKSIFANASGSYLEQMQKLFSEYHGNLLEMLGAAARIDKQNSATANRLERLVNIISRAKRRK